MIKLERRHAPLNSHVAPWLTNFHYGAASSWNLEHREKQTRKAKVVSVSFKVWFSSAPEICGDYRAAGRWHKLRQHVQWVKRSRESRFEVTINTCYSDTISFFLYYSYWLTLCSNEGNDYETCNAHCLLRTCHLNFCILPMHALLGTTKGTCHWNLKRQLHVVLGTHTAAMQTMQKKIKGVLNR